MLRSTTCSVTLENSCVGVYMKENKGNMATDVGNDILLVMLCAIANRQGQRRITGNNPCFGRAFWGNFLLPIGPLFMSGS